MSKLAAGCLSFGLGVLLTVYLLDGVWLLAACGVVLLFGIVSVFVKGKRMHYIRIVSLCTSFGLLWSFGYDLLYYRPAESVNGTESVVTGVVSDYPLDWQYGSKFDAELMIDGVGINSLVYCHGDELANLAPGDKISFVGEFNLTDSMDNEKTFSLISKGYMLYVFTDEISVVGNQNGIRYTPKAAAKAVRDKLEEVFPEDVSSFLKAMIVGDRTEFNNDPALVNAFSDAGVYHIISVSGLHVSFLAGMIYLLFGRRKWTAAIVVPVIVFFMAMTGFTPSVTRAGVMQIFVVMAAVFNRENDTVTALSFALALILLVNPYAIAHAGLQMSFLATLGITFIGSKLTTGLLKAAKITKKKDRTFLRKVRDRVLYFVITSFSASVGALALTMPLTAVYFGNISLAAPFANLLILWMASFVFSFGLLVCVLGFIWMPGASIAAYPVILAVRYILQITAVIGTSGFAAVYTCNKYIIFWFIYVYSMGAIFVIMKAKPKQIILPVCVSVIILCVVMLFTALDKDTTPMTFTALDVGQGQSVVFTAGEYTAAVDCGGSYHDAGNILGDYILSMGRKRLDVLMLTHYDSDHCNGFDELVERIDIGVLIVPDPKISDTDSGDSIIALAESMEIEIIYAYEDMKIDFGDSTMQIYAPLAGGDENEMCISSLFSCGTFDVLVTGDMNTSVERVLVREKNLPDIEVLVAGHHGSKSSTGQVLLDAVKPETVVISVGANSYGHPSKQVLQRLMAIGAEVYRTDEMGNITITYSGE
ncbi:MAG: DNA internalization-related competence protein ComEC/Rec2 [Ruminococcaceae bacterium]|nr:DNA internalization-related competence protein ComEC/Rec2 [Oscillospiraceae bacterium]